MPRPGKSALVTISILAAAPVAALALLATPSLATAPIVHCSNTGTPQQFFVWDIAAQGVPCAAARRFIVGINTHRPALKARNTSYQGYLCRPQQSGAAGWKIRCTQGQRTIRWLEGT